VTRDPEVVTEDDPFKFYRAEATDSLSIPVGTVVKLESLRQAVVPPYLMLMPFIIVPGGIVVEERHPLGEDGVHGCVYHLRATEACQGEIVVGFRDIRTSEIVRRKVIPVSAA
jgi:hypothetical protein